jgi:hypothetical protein
VMRLESSFPLGSFVESHDSHRSLHFCRWVEGQRNARLGDSVYINMKRGMYIVPLSMVRAGSTSGTLVLGIVFVVVLCAF